MTNTRLSELVDAMIPGSDDFPSASSVGVHGVLTQRLRDLGGPASYQNLLEALGTHEAAATIVARFEREQPELFGRLRLIVYLSYYEQPAVIEVIRANGFDYNDHPQPDGYHLDPFDPAADTPKVRGHFVTTDSFTGDAGRK